MIVLPLSKKQFKEFQKTLEKDQTKTPNANIQIFIESNSKTASGGFGFSFDSSVLRSFK
jgi:hypothetical protein